MPRNCETCGSEFYGASRARYCSDACRCGTEAGYVRGCDCSRCLRAHARHTKRMRCLPTPRLDATGSHRRVQALVRLGYSLPDLSARLNRNRKFLNSVLGNSLIEHGTAKAIADLYDELSMTLATGPLANRNATTALAKGWAAPLEWDEGQIDDPTQKPSGRRPKRRAA